MAYTLKSIVNISKYKGKNVEQCINEHFYAFDNIINKKKEWYSEEVHDYIKECKSKINPSFKKNYRSFMERSNT